MVLSLMVVIHFDHHYLSFGGNLVKKEKDKTKKKCCFLCENLLIIWLLSQLVFDYVMINSPVEPWEKGIYMKGTMQEEV